MYNIPKWQFECIWYSNIGSLLCFFFVVVAVVCFVWLYGSYATTLNCILLSLLRACVFDSVFSFCRLQQHTQKTWSTFTNILRHLQQIQLFNTLKLKITMRVSGTKFNLDACPNIVNYLSYSFFFKRYMFRWNP